jgi:hypothetical protein
VGAAGSKPGPHHRGRPLTRHRFDDLVDEAIEVGHGTLGLCIVSLGCRQHLLPEG